MAARIGAFQPGGLYPSVNLGARHARVPQQLLDRAQIRAAVQQVRGEAVAQRVRADRRRPWTPPRWRAPRCAAGGARRWCSARLPVLLTGTARPQLLPRRACARRAGATRSGDARSRARAARAARSRYAAHRRQRELADRRQRASCGPCPRRAAARRRGRRPRRCSDTSSSARSPQAVGELEHRAVAQLQRRFARRGSRRAARRPRARSAPAAAARAPGRGRRARRGSARSRPCSRWLENSARSAASLRALVLGAAALGQRGDVASARPSDRRRRGARPRRTPTARTAQIDPVGAHGLGAASRGSARSASSSSAPRQARVGRSRHRRRRRSWRDLHPAYFAAPTPMPCRASTGSSSCAPASGQSRGGDDVLFLADVPVPGVARSWRRGFRVQGRRRGSAGCRRSARRSRSSAQRATLSHEQCRSSHGNPISLSQARGGRRAVGARWLVMCTKCPRVVPGAHGLRPRPGRASQRECAPRSGSPRCTAPADRGAGA